MHRDLWSCFADVSNRHGGKVAIFHGTDAISFAGLMDKALCYGSAFACLGIGAGARCLFWAENSIELAAAMLGAWRVGAIVTLINDEAPVAHVVHAMDVTEPSLVVTGWDGSAKIGAHAACPIMVLGSPLSRHGSISPLGPIDPNRAASIFFTSGSTGMPKGVTQSHATLICACANVGRFLGLVASDIILCPIPWSFDYGYGQFLSTIILGIPQVIPSARNAVSLCEAIATHRPSVFAGLPSIFGLLLRGISSIRTTDLRSVRLITNTGGVIPEAIFADLEQLFSHSLISLNYGMTETYRSAGLPLNLGRSSPRSVGFAYPDVTLTIVREDGREAGPGEVGELIHKGAGTFMGYWGAPEATSKILKPDPFWDDEGAGPVPVVFTGDLAIRDEHGFLTIKGRRDRLIKSMGVRVSPDEVETILRRTDLVIDVVIIGVDHEILGQMICAVIMPKENVVDLEHKLKRYARDTMSSHMQPRKYLFLDAFPLTPNGKLDLRAIRSLATAPAISGASLARPA